MKELERLAFETLKFPEPWYWDPQPDITAYEIALCLPILMGPGLQIPEMVRRHFHQGS